MDEYKTNNYALLRGVPQHTPQFSHEARGERFYRFPLEVCRLSGAADVINIIAREDVLDALEPNGCTKLCVEGEVRSFNNKSGIGAKLLITVYAKKLWFDDDDDENVIELRGTICKQPTLRTTPMGREICDLMIAVNRRYGRSDYLPCIAWGARAREASMWPVGTGVLLTGRMQSREYTKTVDDRSIRKTAYEISVITITEDDN